MARQRRSMGSVSEAFERGSDSNNNGVDHVDGRNSSAVNLGRPTRRSARLAQRRRETTNVIDLGSDPTNLENEVANEPSTLQNTGSGDYPLNIDLNESAGDEEVDESEDQRLSNKRKAEEEALSANASSQFEENISQNAVPRGRYNAGGAPTENPPRVDTTPVQLDPRLGIGMRELGSDNHHALHSARNVESSRRNFRARINPAYQQDSAPLNLSLTETANSHLTYWSPHERSASINMTPTYQHNVITNPGVMRSRHLFMSNGAPVIPGERTTAPLEEVDARTFQRNIWGPPISIPPVEEVDARTFQRNIWGPPISIPPVETRNQVQDPRPWSLTNGNMTGIGIIGSLPQVGSSSSAHPSPAAILMSHQNPPTHHMQMFQEVMHQPPFVTSSESVFGGQINNFPPINIGHFTSSGMVYPSDSVQLGNPLHFFPPPPPPPHNHPPRPVPIPVPHPSARRGSRLDQLIARRLGFPPPAQNTNAFDDGRRRVISEIRNALNIMRMGGAGYENIVLLDSDQPIFLSLGEMFDMHQAMRLDVDEMSYENLLDLEEEIGEVHTGLTEEVSLKYLKQRTYPALRIAVPAEGESCCICQEEFVNGVQVGELDCGHIYHTGCITEWLKQKNVCPVCKTTALVTSEEVCSECGRPPSECGRLPSLHSSHPTGPTPS